VSKSKLVLSNRKKRYNDLFYEWEPVIPVKIEPENHLQNQSDIDKFKKMFQEYIINELSCPELTSLLMHDRLKQLKTLLTFDNKLSIGNRSYMIGGQRGNVFVNRPKLPKASEVSE
jgi:hypothetical protein